MLAETGGAGHRRGQSALPLELARRAADHRRDLLLSAAGYRIVRVNWHQLIGEPELFVAALSAFLREAAA